MVIGPPIWSHPPWHDSSWKGSARHGCAHARSGWRCSTCTPGAMQRTIERLCMTSLCHCFAQGNVLIVYELCIRQMWMWMQVQVQAKAKHTTAVVPSLLPIDPPTHTPLSPTNCAGSRGSKSLSVSWQLFTVVCVPVPSVVIWVTGVPLPASPNPPGIRPRCSAESPAVRLNTGAGQSKRECCKPLP
jgi:hypothetical protein